MVKLCLLSLLLTIAPLSLAACGDCETPSDSAWTAVSEDALDDTQRQQRKLAFAAKDDMGRVLVGKLMKSMEAGGPVAAIEVCRTQAPAIAALVGGEHGVVIGRTSFKRRNAANVPPTWAASWVKERRPENAYAAHQDGRLGVLLPITLQNPCLTCHGPAEKIPVEVRGILARLYPEDQATGFAAGDLRGWFWIEVPTP